MHTTSKATRLKKLSAVLLGVMILSEILSAATPALALGDCGPNRHRDRWGRCVGGGQNQAWCLRHTGHVATPGPDGTRWCVR
jgi:hypothetical protein